MRRLSVSVSVVVPFHPPVRFDPFLNVDTITTIQEGAVRRDVTGEVVLQESWEAKYTLSPSTLFDAISKKVLVIRSICDDPDAILSCDFRSKRFFIENRQVGTGIDSALLFGIYGLLKF